MKNTQVVIPMAGKSQRFFDYGYTKPKSLIEFNGLPMIGHILKIFKDFDDILVIANTHDFNKYDLQNFVSKLHKGAKVINIDTHNLGPSFSILKAKDQISITKKIIVHYCDFSGTWNPIETINLLNTYDGVFVTFSGFHPSKINKTKFAYGKTDGTNRLLKIKEKGSFTSNPENELASSGIYGFASGEMLIGAISDQIASNLQINGEFYTSLTQEVMLNKNKNIVTQNMESFSAWGTPEDLESFMYFTQSCSFINKVSSIINPVIDHTGIILAAGKSLRLKLNNEKPKQLKNIVNESNLLDYSKKLIIDKSNIFLVATSKVYPKNIWNLEKDNLAVLSHATESQLSSVQIGLSLLKNKNSPVTFLASDNLIHFEENFKISEKLSGCDILVWAAKDYPISTVQPDQYSWIKVNDENIIENVIYKKSPVDLRNWKIITGNFTFRTADLVYFLIDKFEDLYSKLQREPILDDLIGVALEVNMAVKVLDVPNFMTLGSEMENDTFDYYSKLINKTI